MIQFDIDKMTHSLDEVRTLLDPRCMLHLGKEAKKRIAKCRNYLDERMKNQKAPIYGVTTGFGSLCNVSVDKDQLSQLQKNLVMSHACGVGEEVRPEIVRLMFLRLFWSKSRDGREAGGFLQRGSYSCRIPAGLSWSIRRPGTAGKHVPAASGTGRV